MRLIFISLDACFQKDAELLLNMPNLSYVAKNGVFCDNVQTIYPSITYPIHSSILTGCYPERHGIAHNHIFDAGKRSKDRAWHWEAKDIKAPTLMQALHKQGKTIASLFWPVIGKTREVKYLLPEVLALKGENQTLKVLRYGSALWLLRCEMKFSKYREGTKQPALDRFSTKLAESLILETSCRRCPDAIFLHLVCVDDARHFTGVYSKEAMEGLKALDDNVGVILSALRQKGFLEDSLICIASDHGQADVYAHFNLNEAFAKDGVPAVSQSIGFGAYIHVKEEDYEGVKHTLLENMDKYQIAKVYTREDLRARRADGSIILALEAKEGVEFLNDESDYKEMGNHGFGIEHEGAKTLLWLMGKGIKKGARLAGAHVVDIAPTLAKALKLPFADCQGSCLEDVFI